MESLHSQDTVNSTEKQFGLKLVDISVAPYLLNDCFFIKKKKAQNKFLFQVSLCFEQHKQSCYPMTTRHFFPHESVA